MFWHGGNRSENESDKQQSSVLDRLGAKGQENQKWDHSQMTKVNVAPAKVNLARRTRFFLLDIGPVKPLIPRNTRPDR